MLCLVILHTAVLEHTHIHEDSALGTQLLRIFVQYSQSNYV